MKNQAASERVASASLSPERSSPLVATALPTLLPTLLMQAPPQVDVDKVATLPAVVTHAGSIRDIGRQSFRATGWIVAMDLNGNRLSAVSARTAITAANDSDDEPVDKPPTDPALLPEGSMETSLAIDLRVALNLPWRPGQHLFIALLGQLVSNRARVSLLGAATAGANASKAAVSEDDGRIQWPDCELHDDSIAAPTGPGIVMTLPAAVRLPGTTPWCLRGAFRLTPTRAEWAAPLEVQGGAAPWQRAHPDAPLPEALMALWIVLVGEDDGEAHFIELRLASWLRVGDRCVGQFKLDLREIPCAPTIPQTYAVYAFSGDNMAGPVISAVFAPAL